MTFALLAILGGFALLVWSADRLIDLSVGARNEPQPGMSLSTWLLSIGKLYL